LPAGRNPRPETTTIAGDIIALRELVNKSADADLLREMIGFAAERMASMPITRLVRFPQVFGQGERWAARQQRIRARTATGLSQGRPATNASSQLIQSIGLPALRALSYSQPKGGTI
jgi:hypothetical protein